MRIRFKTLKNIALIAVFIAMSSVAWADAGKDVAAALVASRQGNLKQAIHLLSRAINAGGMDVESLAAAHNYRGISYRLLGDSDRATADYTEAINLLPDFAAAYSNRALANAKRGRYDSAIGDFTKALKLDPGSGDLYLKRGNAFFDKGLLDEAINDYGRAIELSSGSVLAYFNRCDAYNNKGLRDKAVRDCTKALQFNPDFGPAREMLRLLGIS